MSPAIRLLLPPTPVCSASWWPHTVG